MQNDSTVNGCWFVCGCDPPVFVTEFAARVVFCGFGW
jgi:hypothetical protein